MVVEALRLVIVVVVMVVVVVVVEGEGEGEEEEEEDVLVFQNDQNIEVWEYVLCYYKEP